MCLLLLKPLLFEAPLIETHGSGTNYDEESTEEGVEVGLFVLDGDLEKECEHDVVHPHQCSWTQGCQLEAFFFFFLKVG